MKRLILPLALVSLAACAADAPPPPEPADRVGGDGPAVCPADVHECRDGSFVVRDPENQCRFKSCPEDKTQPAPAQP